MPLYDYTCDAGHVFERMAAISDFDKAVLCKCGRPAARVVLRAPGMNFGHGVAKVYHEHNITHRHERAGGVTALPNSPADQCGCGDCSQHRRRASVTDVAEPGKDRYAP